MKDIPHGALCLCAACQALPRSVIDTYLREVVFEVCCLYNLSYLWRLVTSFAEGCHGKDCRAVFFDTGARYRGIIFIM